MNMQMHSTVHTPTCAMRALPLLPVIPGHSQLRSSQAFTQSLQGRPSLYATRCRKTLQCRAESQTSTTEDTQATAPSTSNGQASQNGTGELPSGELVFTAPSGLQKFATSLRLIRALPWRRFKKGSVLVIELGGGITEKRQGRFGDAKSMPQIISALKKAAYDPRISGILLKLSPLSAGWAKLEEIRQYIKFFRQSGKFSMAYIAQGGEKEYYAASACEEVYVPPSGSLSLRGLGVAGTFLRGVLEKVGVEPNIKRIGKYKSAGDQLLRKDMSEAQREQLTAILDDLYEGFTDDVAASKSKSSQEVEAMLDRGIFRMEEYVEGGWVTGLKYEDELIKDLEKRTDSKPNELKAVGLKKYAAVSAKAFGLVGKKRLAVIRAAGAIVGGSGGSPAGGTITAAELVRQIRLVGQNKAFSGLILRVDSPGGDALASDLIWRELRVLAEKKPVIASMGDVAASGGYYLAMAASKIVAERLTITGSIGVITGKFNLEKLYGKVGYTKELISKGRYAELLADSRTFTEEEDAYFSEQAQYAYESFRNKAALSRGMQNEQMQQHAQGRVWSGKRALEVGLVDALGGLSRAVAIAKQELKIPDSENVSLIELSREQMSPLMLLSGGASANVVSSIVQGVLSLGSEGALVQLLTQGLKGASADVLAFNVGPQPMAVMPDIKVRGASELL